MMAGRRRREARARCRGRRAWLCTLLFCAVTLVAILPHLGVVLIASSKDWYASVLPTGPTLDNYRAALGHELTVPAIANSLKYASASTVIDVFLGVAIAYVVVRTRMAGRHVLDFLAMLPLAVPGIVLAFGYLAMSHEGRLFDFINPVQEPDRPADRRLLDPPAARTSCARPRPASSRQAPCSRRRRRASAAPRSGR